MILKSLGILPLLTLPPFRIHSFPDSAHMHACTENPLCPGHYSRRWGVASHTTDQAPALKGLTFQWEETDQGKSTNKTKTQGDIRECDHWASGKVSWGR